MQVNNLNFTQKIAQRHNSKNTMTNPNLLNNDNSDTFVKSTPTEATNQTTKGLNITFGDRRQEEILLIRKEIQYAKTLLMTKYKLLSQRIAPDIQETAQKTVNRLDEIVQEHIPLFKGILKDIKSGNISVDSHHRMHQFTTENGTIYHCTIARKDKSNILEISTYSDNYKTMDNSFKITPSNNEENKYTLNLFSKEFVGKIINADYTVNGNNGKMNSCLFSHNQPISQIKLNDDKSGYDIIFKCEENNIVELPPFTTTI